MEQFKPGDRVTVIVDNLWTKNTSGLSGTVRVARHNYVVVCMDSDSTLPSGFFEVQLDASLVVQEEVYNSPLWKALR